MKTQRESESHLREDLFFPCKEKNGSGNQIYEVKPICTVFLAVAGAEKKRARLCMWCEYLKRYIVMY